MRSECGNCRRLCAGVLIAAAVLGAHFPRGGVTAAGAGGGRSGGVNAEVSGSWLTAGEQYVYSYTSSAAIHSNIELVVETKVRVSVVKERQDGGQEIRLQYDPIVVQWTSDNGVVRDDETFRDMSGWFSMSLSPTGQAISVQYPPHEQHTVVSLKKTIASLFTIEQEGEVNRTVVSDGVQLSWHYTQQLDHYKKDITKELTHSSERGLVSAQLHEVAITTATTSSLSLFGGNLTSTSSLYFLKQQPLPSDDSHMTTEELVKDSLEISKAHTQTPLAKLQVAIDQQLSCFSSDHDCRQQLVDMLGELSQDDLDRLLTQYTESSGNDAVLLSLVDAIAQSSSPYSTHLLIKHILQSQYSSDLLVRRVLYYLTTTLTPDEESVKAIKSLIMKESTPQDLRHLALLALGGMGQNSSFSQEISQFLLSALDQHTGALVPDSNVPSRSPLSSLPYSTITHTTLLDAIGNSGSHSTKSTILPHVRGHAAHSSLSTQHAALRALRHIHDRETADVLEEVAEDDRHHPSVQLAAARMYQSHPLASRDLSHVITRRSTSDHVRARRQAIPSPNTTSHQYNTTMPAVGWNTHFGENNISVDLHRGVYNSFEIRTDPFSSLYRFSIHDSASFTANLLLNNREEHTRFLRTDLCLSGQVSYDTNIMTDYSQLQLVHKFNRLQRAIPTLASSLTAAYNLMLSSQDGYSSIKSDFQTSFSSTGAQFATVLTLLDEFTAAVSGISVGSSLSERAVNISKLINSTRMNALGNYTNAVMDITAALDSLLPAKLSAFVSSIQPGNQPFTTSSFYLPYLEYAPQKAMNNIYSVYRSAGRSLDELRSSTESVLALTSPHGDQSSWTNPGIVLWPLSGDISDLLRDVEEEIVLATEQNNPTLSGLQILRAAIVDYLRPSYLTLLENVTAPIATSSAQLRSALDRTTQGYDSFTRGYEAARSSVDTIFGQQFHPVFPSKLRPCYAIYGCGNYPATTGGRYHEGIDLIVESAQQIIAPFSGIINLFNQSAIPALSGHNYSSTDTLVLTPSEFSLDSIIFIMSNVAPLSSVTAMPTFFLAGSSIGSTGSFQVSGRSFIHIEAYKILGGVAYPVDPTQFLALQLSPSASITWDCNDMVTYVRGAVVDMRPASSTAPTSQLVGDPLVNIVVPDHEFPQPIDLVLEGAEHVQSPASVQFFQTSTFLMVGPIPVTLAFSSTGQYHTNMSMKAGLLSKQFEVTTTPYVQARMHGSARVGGATYATVTLQGNLVESSLPLSLVQDFGQWPLVANSSMDLQLVPSNLNLTSWLVRITSTGTTPTEEVINSQILWQYLVPSVNRNEYRYAGTTPDPSLPSLLPLPYSDSTSCFVRQLSGRSYANPAFELEIYLSEPQGVPNISYRVGTYEHGDDVINDVEIAGARVVVPHSLVPAQQVYVTVEVTNQIPGSSVGECAMPVYDRSPPLARVVPIRQLTSRPDQFEVLLSLFDEYGLEDIQYVAMGTVAGEHGDNIADWQAINVTHLINTPPTSDPYAFPRNGRLLGSVISLITTTTVDLATCQSSCDSNVNCKSLDFSSEQRRCILHSSVEGPHTPPDVGYTNNFAMTPLLPSQGFEHYEELGVGNSTLYTFTGLALRHRQRFFVNLRLRNKLGYSNLVSSDVVVVDLTPPYPGRIRNAARDEVIMASSFPLTRLVGTRTTIPNHRIISDGPGSATVFNGPVPLFDALYTSASNFIAANWDGFEDPESGIYRYTWCISSTTLYECDVLTREDPHLDLNPITWSNRGLYRSTDLLDGSYYITVDAINSVEYGGSLVTTVMHSTPYVLDTQAPVVESLDLIGYNQSTNQITVSYNISDVGSGVEKVELSVGRTSLDNDVIGWVVIATDTGVGVATVGVNISDGVTSYVKLRATDKIANEVVMTVDTPIRVDRTPPISGRVNDGNSTSSDTDYQHDTTMLCVSWDRFSDPHTGISRYQWLAGTSPGDNSTLSAHSLTASEIAARSACMSGLTLVDGVRYYSTIIAYNGEGLSVSMSSDGVTIDTSPPTPGTVLDGDLTRTNISYSSSLTTVSVTWSGFEDLQSGICSYIVSIHSQPVGSTTTRLLHAEIVNGTGFTSNQFSFTTGDRVHAQVEAFNGAGLKVIGSSDGFLVDVTPPQVNVLSDGLVPGTDVQYQNVTNSLSFNWDAFDDESGIETIAVAVFQVTEGVRTRVYPNPTFTDTPTMELPSSTVTSYTITGLSLTSGARYIIAVTFTNGAGLHHSTYETNGVIIDQMAPVVTMVTVLSDGYLLDDGEERMGVVANRAEVEARWSGRDDESEIVEYLVAVVTVDTDTILNPGGDYFRFGLEVGGVVRGLNLTSGSSSMGPFYRVKIIAVDNAGIQSAPLYSENFWVAEGDHAGVVYDGSEAGQDIDYTDELTAVSAHFSGFFIQQCGGVSEFLWAVGRSKEEKSSLLPFTDIGVVFNGDGSGYAQTLLPNLRSYQGQRLYTTVRAITGCGDILEATSDGFIVDSTPPSLSVLRTGSQAVEVIQNGPTPSPAHQMYQNIDTYSSIWAVVDNESGLANDVVVKIGSFPGGADVQNGTETPANYIRDEMKTAEGVSTYVTVEAENKAGLVQTAYSQPVVLDTSLPPMGEITCSSHLPTSPPLLPTISSQLICSWVHTSDKESTVASQTISIATDKLDQSRLYSVMLPGNKSNFTSPVLNFTSGRAYYVTLYSTNGAGLENILTSAPVYYDVTPPVLPLVGVAVLPNSASAVYEGVSEGVLNVRQEDAAVCVLDTDWLTVRFGVFNDSETGIERYEVGVGHTPGGDEVVTYHTIQPTASSTDENILLTTLDRVTFDLTNQRPFYITVRACNRAGLYFRETSQPVYVIAAANTRQSAVTDGDMPNKDIDYQNMTTYMSGHVEFGVNCPMRELEWAIENVDGNLTLNFTSIEPHPVGGATSNSYFLSTDNIRLNDDEAYRVVVRGFDYTGRLHLLKSNGTSVTTKPLLPGSVNDGPVPNLDLSFQESVSTLSAHWTGFGEENAPEQEIVYYEIAAGSDRQYASTRSDVFPFTSVGLRTSYNITGLSLRPMSHYYITVRAHAVSGATADATSNGIRVGYGHMITPGVITVSLYQSDNTSITARWSGFESDLPLIQYEWALGSRNISSQQSLQTLCDDITSDYASQFEVFGFENVGLDTLQTRTGLSLRHGSSYYVTLRVVDQAKRCVIYSSPIPTVIDQTPPTGNKTTVGPAESRIGLSDSNEYRAYVNSGDDISLEWMHFSDAESPIDYYEVGFFELAACTSDSDNFTTGSQVIGYTNVGMATTFTFKELNLEANKSYVASIRGTNLAGLNTTLLSQPIVPDVLTLISGSVKDGRSWDRDLVFQSDVSSLSATFSHAVIRPPSLSGNLSQSLCPNNTLYELISDHAQWGALTPSTLDGLSDTSIRYDTDQVDPSTNPPGRAITAIYGLSTITMDSGAYQTSVPRLNEGDVTVSLNIRAALGTRVVQDAAITSVVFIDSPDAPNLLADFDLAGNGFSNPDLFRAFGLQIHHSYTSGSVFHQHKVVMWSKDNQTLSEPRYVTQNVTFDLSVPHRYELRFASEQLGLTFVRKVDLFVDGVIQATLHGLPEFSPATRMLLHVFMRGGFVPPCDGTCPAVLPSVTAVFSDVSLPPLTGEGDGVCIHGNPFYSWTTPIVVFRAGVGTQPGLTDVKGFETVIFPCHPCLPGTCSSYACDTACPDSNDPYITTFTLTSLSLPSSPAPSTMPPATSGSGSGSAEIATGLDPSQTNFVNLTLGTSLSPGTYFITVEAVSASGQRVTSSSNGVLIDTSPPQLALPIDQFDVQFSTTQDTRYQGNNSTISARWLFIDEESGIVEYEWSIGTSPYGDDVQPFISIAMAAQAINNTLELVDNTTYYVTIRAHNGAGLTGTATSHGITYQNVQLNRTQLVTVVMVEHVREVVVAGDNGTLVRVLVSESTERARVEWAGITDDVAETFWYIGSEPQTSDILPRTDVSFNNGRSATIDAGVLYVDSAPLANLSDIITLTDGVSAVSVNGLSFEPGRLLYHRVEFCSLAHTCVTSDPLSSIVIRPSDTEISSSSTGFQVTLTQSAPSNETVVLNKQYDITITMETGLLDDERVFAGFLSEEDVTRGYHVAVPYISNPYMTMDQTSREIARRFSAIGGPSFFISFLGRDSLPAALELNVSIDSSVELTTSQVELAYWDIDDNVWREVDDTCQSDSVVDMATRTIRVEVCSTVLPGQDPATLSRPVSLSRRRRQTNSTSNTTNTDTNTTATPTSLNYLDRPVHFIVMEVGNLSLNTAPSLSFPGLETQEETVLSVSLKQYVRDMEGDDVRFSLTSVPRLGRVNLTEDGQLTYVPCQDCYGVEELDITVVEVMFDANHVPLSAMSRLNVTIHNTVDNPVLFFYDGLDRANTTLLNAVTIVNVTVETNQTTPTVVAKVGGYDVDGSANFLQPTVNSVSGGSGSSGYVTWLRAFTVAQSLPIHWPAGSELFNFTGSLAFIGINITYQATGDLESDQISVSVRDSGSLFTVSPLTVNIQIVPSWCVNGGVCAGSPSDPECTNVTTRRDNPAEYSCTCPPDYTGQYCEESLVPVTPSPPPVCPDGTPLVRCDRDPCADASCPSHRDAVCRPSYCGRCVAEWFVGTEKVTCSASNSTVCHHPLPVSVAFCSSTQCPCPPQPYECPEDSILVEHREGGNPCCVTYSCQCPVGSCPHLMECVDNVTPVPAERGVARPGRCCPQYDYISSNSPSRRNTTDDDGFPSDCPFYGEMLQRATVGCNDCHCASSWLYCDTNSCSGSTCVYNGQFIVTATSICTNTAGHHSCTCLHTDHPLVGVWGECTDDDHPSACSNQ